MGKDFRCKKRWIPDISVVFSIDFKQRAFENEYAQNNPGVDLDELSDTIGKLKGIANRQIGVIELDHSLDIDEVTEIFIRINSKGTALSQSDFVMSKMAADTTHGGGLMRKAVDYFCHLASKPDFYPHMTHDAEFQASKYADKIKWLAKDYGQMEAIIRRSRAQLEAEAQSAPGSEALAEEQLLLAEYALDFSKLFPDGEFHAVELLSNRPVASSAVSGKLAPHSCDVIRVDAGKIPAASAPLVKRVISSCVFPFGRGLPFKMQIFLLMSFTPPRFML